MKRFALALIALAWGHHDALAGCPSEVEIIEELTCSSVVTSQLLPGVSHLDSYTCGTPFAPLSQMGPEHVYSFRCQANGTVRLDVTDLDCDLDIYILDDTCDPGAGCLAGSTAAGTADDGVDFHCLAGETYYVVIEGWGYGTGGCSSSGSQGWYTLSFDLSAGTGCEEDCTDGIDNSLNGLVDCEDPVCFDDPACCDDGPWFPDADGDGFGDAHAEPLYDCNPPEGYVDNNLDCDDDDPDVYPGAPEICDGVDNNCDGLVDLVEDEATGELIDVCYEEEQPDGGDPSGSGVTRHTVDSTCGCATPALPLAPLGALLLPLLVLRRRR